MSIQMVHFAVKSDYIIRFETAIEKLVKSLEKLRPAGVNYTVYHTPNNSKFVGVLQLEDGVENPLPTLPEGKLFRAESQNWVEAPPVIKTLTVLAEFRSLSVSGVAK
jgi:hypothetical protein